MTYVHIQKLPDNFMLAAGAAGIALGLTPIGFLARLAVWGTVGATIASFRVLTVKVDDTEILLKFGDGLIKKSQLLCEVESVQIVRTNFLQGFGIHYVGNGWLYNIYGLDAVELSLADGKRLLIGSDDCANLAEAIKERLPT